MMRVVCDNDLCCVLEYVAGRVEILFEFSGLAGLSTVAFALLVTFVLSSIAPLKEAQPRHHHRIAGDVCTLEYCTDQSSKTRDLVTIIFKDWFTINMPNSKNLFPRPQLRWHSGTGANIVLYSSALWSKWRIMNRSTTCRLIDK